MEVNMRDSILAKSYEYFNKQDLEGFASFWHDDIKVYDLKTNELRFEGKDILIKYNLEPCSNPNKRIILENVIIRDNFEFAFKTWSYMSGYDIIVLEIKDGKMKTVWFTRVNE